MKNLIKLNNFNKSYITDRYISWPGQALSYKIGELKIRELRKLAENELGSAFDIREFHAQVLNTGGIPLAILEQKIGVAVSTFCFPNGDFSEEAHNLVCQHYDAAVTTMRGINTADKLSPHSLLRIGVHNDISDTPLKFKARLSNFGLR